MSTLPEHAGRAPAGALPSPHSADPSRARVCRRTRLAVSELLTDVVAGCGRPQTTVDAVLAETAGHPAGRQALGAFDRITVECLAVALDQLGYDLVLTAEPREDR